MSEDSEKPNIEPKETENGNNGNASEIKLKRNYCYVCEVQCTAVRNYLEHQKGKKHLKKLNLVKEAEERRQKKLVQRKTQKNPTKKLKSSNSQEANDKKSKVSELNGITVSSSDVINSENKVMNNSTRQTPKYKRSQCINSRYQNTYSRYQNSKYSYSKHYGNEKYLYNEQPYASYPVWNTPHYPNAPLIPNNSYNNYNLQPDSQYYENSNCHAPFQNECFATNENADFDFNNSSNKALYVHYIDSESPTYSSSRNEMFEKKQMESNSGNSKNSSPKEYSSHRNHSTEIVNSKQSASSMRDLNLSSTSAVVADNSTNSSLMSPQVSGSSDAKAKESNRLRSRSLSSTENINNDKRLKDKNENQLLDSDGASEEQKLKEYTTCLLETNPNKISRMIQHPSNYKEKAVLNHIMTSFSKTRRKESLTRKLRSNSLGSAGNDDITLEVQSTMSENEEVSLVISSQEVTCAQISTCVDEANKCSPSVRKTKNSPDVIDIDLMLSNEKSSDTADIKSPVATSVKQNYKKSSKGNEKSKESSISTSSKKTTEKKNEKSSELVYSDKSVKRKSIDCATSSKKKKQRFSDDARNFERSNMSTMTKQNDLLKSITSAESTFNHSSNTQIIPESHCDILPVKEEVADCTDVNQVACVPEEIPQTSQEQIVDFNTQISVETLIELFASGNVKVKKEFNDPVIEAIKAVDPNELMNACSNESSLNKVGETNQVTLKSNVECHNDKSSSAGSVLNSTDENTACIDPVILGSAVVSNNITPVSLSQWKNHPLPNSSTEKSNDQSLSTPDSIERDEDNTLSEIQKLNLIHRTKSEFPHLNTMIEELQEIASREEKVKQNIAEAKSKINEYQSLLEEWKNKKKKFHDEEENLRKKRNGIIKLMQNTIEAGSSTRKESKTKFLPEVHSTPEREKGLTNKGNVETGKGAQNSNSSTSDSSPEVSLKRKKPETSSESDEILILPSPVKPKPPEIIIVDETEENASATQASKKSSKRAGELSTSVVSDQGPNMFNTKSLAAHSTVINCIVVFEDFLYTCSNDNTAKRFNLKDVSQTVTYLHTAKNVTEIAVEKVQNEALVFTSCSNRVLSLFIASNGTKIKTFFQPSTVTSICKGWGKFYAALTDGSVNVYNWKYEEKEIVKTENSACRIAAAHQGRLHILIILTSDGNVALRDAETGLLIRLIKGFVKIPSWLTVHNDSAYLSSSDKTLSILDIMSGRFEKKLYLNNHATGLAVYDDNIFTISYTGMISCYNKDKVSEKKLFYGAGRNGLTCIHVFQDWVFTGNRKGDVSLFQFDEYSIAPCKFSTCNSKFGLKEDLEFHVEKDHLLKKKNVIRCQWGICNYLYPTTYNVKDKLNHVKKHIYSVPLQLPS